MMKPNVQNGQNEERFIEIFFVLNFSVRSGMDLKRT